MSFIQQQKSELEVESRQEGDGESEYESYFESSEDWNDEIQFENIKENQENSYPATVRTPQNKSERNFVI